MLPLIFLLATSNACSDFTLINKTPNWTTKDEQALSRGLHVCYTEYNGCMSKFIKRKKQTYWILCRRGEKNAN